MNRLKLNFTLDTVEERSAFIKTYLTEPTFQVKPPTQDELEMCGNYILWGKEPDGKNIVQKKLIQIDTKNNTWSDKKEESLDALMESVTFNEHTIVPKYEAKTKNTRVVFDRQKELDRAPDSLQDIYKNLFKQIDELDLKLNYYDLAKGKRTKPPRRELLEKFSEEQRALIKEKGEKLTLYRYYKERHRLVELRQEQFTIKDSYTHTIRKTTPTIEAELDRIVFDSDVPVFPLGVLNGQDDSKLVFQQEATLIPENFSEEQLRAMSSFYWTKKNQRKEKRFVDFRDLEHVYEFLAKKIMLQDAAFDCNVDSTTQQLLDTLDFYIQWADFPERELEILAMKIAGYTNNDIVYYVNKKYGTTYTANYISTIYRQKIIKEINNAAALHEEIIGKIFFKEEFKRCNTCGKMLIINSDNFVRKARAKDGFTNRCKKCDKEHRLMKKQKGVEL